MSSTDFHKPYYTKEQVIWECSALDLLKGIGLCLCLCLSLYWLYTTEPSHKIESDIIVSGGCYMYKRDDTGYGDRWQLLYFNASTAPNATGQMSICVLRRNWSVDKCNGNNNIVPRCDSSSST